MTRALAVCACLVAVPAAASTSGYVYVAVPAAACAQASPCAAPQLVVLDAATSQQVISIALPVHTTPKGIALSADGTRLYVSTAGSEFSASPALTVIDARHHTVLNTFTMSSGEAGRIAVRGDATRVYMLPSAIQPGDLATRLDAIDPSSGAVVGSVAVGDGTNTYGAGLAVSASLDRVYVVTHSPLITNSGPSVLSAYDASLTFLAQGSVPSFVVDLKISHDTAKLFAATASSGSTAPAAVQIVNASTLAVTAGPFSTYDAVAPAEFANGDLLSFFGAISKLLRISTADGSMTQVAVAGLANPADFVLPPAGTQAFVNNLDSSGSLTGKVLAVSTSSGAIVGSFAFSQVPLLANTPWGAQSCTYALDTAYVSFNAQGFASAIDTSKPGTVHLTTDCAWQAVTSAPWIHEFNTSGNGNATLSVSVENNLAGSRRQGTIVIGGQVVTVTQAGSGTQPPFGVVDTPANGAIVNGAIAVTGWALDDVGVDVVQVYRGPGPNEVPPPMPIFLGNATLVTGARPDVQALYSTYPFANRAGWGYQLLTNMLPGDGSYVISATAVDVEGHPTSLGSRTVTVNNASSTLPFGAIDTPSQGQTVSGTILNWGWALTPQPGSIATDGSAIDVVIDNVVVGHPTYGLDRSDIATLFPNYANTHSAVGYLSIDTTTMTNGVHTIAWVVHDSLGRAQGIGSRYFTVQNP